MGVSKKSVSWTSKFVTSVLQEHGRRSDVTFLVQTFRTRPYVKTSMKVAGLNADPGLGLADVFGGLDVDPQLVLVDVIRGVANV